jgi:hypothetical protein
MEILIDSNIVKPGEVNGLMNEANEILKVVSTARKSVSNK